MSPGLRYLPILAAAAFAVFTAPVAAEPKPAADPSLTASDSTLVQDEAKAITEFQRRLRDQVSLKNGVLVIVDHSGTTAGVTVMPATVMWGIDCGDSGITATFGSGSGDTDNGVTLQLTGASVSDDKCGRIAPAIGATVLDIAKGN
jgi:hypothetical protein